MEGLVVGIAAARRRGRRVGGVAGRPRQPQPGAADAQGHGAAEEGRDGAGRHAEGTGEGALGTGTGFI